MKRNVVKSVRTELTHKILLFQFTDPPRCPGNRTYCEDPVNYPQDIIQQILRVNNVPLSKFLSEQLPIVDKLKAYEVNNLCDSRVQMIYPKVCRNKAGLLRYIVNHNEYVQGLVVEICEG